jgi:plastocyanin
MGKYVGIALILVVIAGSYLWWQSAQQPGLQAPAPSLSTDEGAAGNMPVGTDMTGDPEESPIPGGMMDAGMMEGSPAATITYDGTKFSPSSVTVKKGEIVRWVNNSSQATWPASAIHPTHSVYPEKTSSDCLGSAFDACKGLKQGESWDFKFNTPGEWRYHDHLHASQTGVVIVQE